MTDTHHAIERQRRIVLRQRIDTMLALMLDAVERRLETLAAPPAPTRSAATTRRQVANTLRLWQFCATLKCRRAQCCRGDPSSCLRYGLPLIPPDALARLLASHGRTRRRRHPHFSHRQSALASRADTGRAQRSPRARGQERTQNERTQDQRTQNRRAQADARP